MLTVHEIMTLDNFKNFRLIAGIAGLETKVSRAGFIDHEVAEDVRKFVIPNEMIFSNLVQIKDEPEKIYDIVEALIEQGSSCFAIKTVFFKEIPQDVIDLANKHKYPLFLFEETYIENLILDVDSASNIQKVLQKKVLLIDEMLSSQKDLYAIRTLAKQVNRQFLKCMTVLYVTKEEETPLEVDRSSIENILGKSSSVIPYLDGDLIIITYTRDNSFDLESTLQAIGLNQKGYYIGCSDPILDLGHMNDAIEQAIVSNKFALYKQVTLSKYVDIGLYKILIPIMENRLSYTYYDGMIQLLVDYDMKNKSDLLNTAQVYIAKDGNVKDTARDLFQHQNTLRYRIKKIYELLELDRLKGMQYETLAVAIHLYNLNNM